MGTVSPELRAMTKIAELHHPNLITLYGAGKKDDTCWIAMEFVDGEPLTTLIEKFSTLKMLDWQFALKVGVQLARALEAAYEKHIIQRNIPPTGQGACGADRRQPSVPETHRILIGSAVISLQDVGPNLRTVDRREFGPCTLGRSASTWSASFARSLVYGR